ncbi:hypothetical protein [Nocardioides sp.]|uniref:hypothetical protein n=1 Tax=Nocardioides sp. TaxID=35761 RepID=UPI001A220EA1|nr:hypothetical protein [Nocardioides sp.]MBJ7359497.1 hypothetical protein [Nocardioides sp.]
MTILKLPRSAFANVTATLALAVSLGGGAYAAGLAKDSVRSKQIKDGVIRTVDLKSGAVTGAKVADGSLTGADIDESTLDLPTPPTTPSAVADSVHSSPKTSGTLGEFSTKLAEVTIDVPAAGYVDATATAMLNGSAGSDVIDVFVMDVSTEVARGYWDAGDADGMFDISQSAHGVVPVSPGRHTFKLFVAEYSTNGTYSGFAEAQLIVRYFPEGRIG